MANPQRKMVRRAGHGPVLNKGGNIGSKTHAGVRVAGSRDGPRDGFPFRHHKLEMASGAHTHAENGDGPVLNLELDRHALAELAVIECQPSQGGFFAADGDVAGPIVPDKNVVVEQVRRMQFCK